MQRVSVLRRVVVGAFSGCTSFRWRLPSRSPRPVLSAASRCVADKTVWSVPSSRSLFVSCIPSDHLLMRRVNITARARWSNECQPYRAFDCWQIPPTISRCTHLFQHHQCICRCPRVSVLATTHLIGRHIFRIIARFNLRTFRVLQTFDCVHASSVQRNHSRIAESSATIRRSILSHHVRMKFRGWFRGSQHEFCARFRVVDFVTRPFIARTFDDPSIDGREQGTTIASHVSQIKQISHILTDA